MGCDIHAYVEYKRADSSRWDNFGGQFRLDRNYWIFGRMATGVRVDVENSVDPKGRPSDLGYAANSDAFLWIGDEDGESSCTLAQALSWKCEIQYHDGKPWLTEHPDWHSHSWLTTAEFESVINDYLERDSPFKCPEYSAILAAMKYFESEYYMVRLVFWFDN